MAKKKLTKGGSDGGIEQIDAAAMRQNMSVLEYSRTCQSAAGGCAAGIMGLTGIMGFLFYFATCLVQALLWYIKTGANVRQYFLDRTVLFSHSLLGGLFTYILFWTFLYGMVHVY